MYPKDVIKMLQALPNDGSVIITNINVEYVVPERKVRDVGPVTFRDCAIAHKETVPFPGKF